MTSAENTDNKLPQEPKLCIECGRPIPLAAKRCTNEGCGAFQDWRRFLGEQFNFISLLTVIGLVITILINIFQVRELATKATKSDVKDLSQSIETRMPQLKAEIDALQRQILAVPEESSNRYRSFLQQPNSGIIKILPRGKYEEVMLMQGGGAYYSFVSRSSEYGYGSDIEFIVDPNVKTRKS